MNWTPLPVLAGILCLLSIQILGQGINQHESTTVHGESQDSLADCLNGFGYRLMMQVLEKNETANVVMSPLGVSVLLAMALLGSTGSTYEEIADVLGFSRDILLNRKRHEELGLELQLLNDPFTKTTLADAVFVDQRSRLRDVYRDFLRHVYRGEAQNADFADSSRARIAINEWVKMRTEQKIDNFLSDNLPTSTKVVLLTALYFKGQWEKPFWPGQTSLITFRTPTKNIISHFMLNAGEFRHVLSANDGLQMIAMPYNDSVTTMYALKPLQAKRLTLTKLLQSLDYAKIDRIINRMNNEKCVVRFPKMNIESHLNLEKYIKLVGAPSMFNTGKANFALMVDGAPEIGNKSEADLLSRIKGDEESRNLKELLDGLANPGIHVDSIIQEVKINIDEYGTEATAATAVTLARSAVLFYADSPFFMFIRNERTKLVTFSAVIFDPSDNIY